MTTTTSSSKRITLASLLAVAVAGAACSREEPEAPPAQVQSQTAQPVNAPATVTGCLRAGDAADTYVLTTTSETQGGAPPVTYNLAGREGVNLQDHIGNVVEITGVITDQQTVATRDATAQPADQKATGTSGTPSVQTSTQLSVRRLDVQTVRPSSGKCE